MYQSASGFPAANANAAPAHPVVTLTLGGATDGLSAARSVFLAADARLRVALVVDGAAIPATTVAFDRLTPLMLRAMGTQVVLSCAVTPTFDAYEVAARLNALGFAGRYIALAQSLPDPHLIRREINALARKFTFDVLSVGQAEGSRPAPARPVAAETVRPDA